MTEPLDTARVDEMSRRLEEILAEAGKVVVGQRPMLEGLLVGLLTGGHVLLEGVPGLAKTLAVRTLAGVIDAGFQRIQFTPDLLPADIIGTTVYEHEKGDLLGQEGAHLQQHHPGRRDQPRAGQGAERPARGHAGAAGHHRRADLPAGRPLPGAGDAEPDRAGGHLPAARGPGRPLPAEAEGGLPDARRGAPILDRMAGREPPRVRPVISRRRCWRCAGASRASTSTRRSRTTSWTSCSPRATPPPTGWTSRPLIAYGASPRATLALAQASRARALLAGRAFVVPEDVKAVGHDVLRHRVLVTYEAEAERKTSDDIITYLFDHVEVP